MKSLRILLSVACGGLLVLLSGSGCDWFKSKPTKPELVIVNVLDKEYHEDCRIKGSINVPFMQVAEYAKKHWNKESTHLVFYCGNYKCTASGAAARQLKAEGYQHVWAYEGGTAEWLQLSKENPEQEYAVEGACQSSFLADYKKPENMHEDAVVITAQELKKKIDEFTGKK